MANSLLHPVYPHDIPISEGYAIHETSHTTSLLNHESWDFKEAIPQEAPAPGHPGQRGMFPLTLKPSGKSIDEERRQQLLARKKHFVAKRQMMPLSPGALDRGVRKPWRNHGDHGEFWWGLSNKG